MQQESQVTLDPLQSDTKWFDEHYSELSEQYPEQWVAIRHGELVSASPVLKDLIANVKASEQSAKDTCFKFVSDKPASRSVTGLSDLYGIWEGMVATDEEIEASKLKIG